MTASQRPETEDRTPNTDRIVVMGTTGVGKTTLAREIARALEVPHVELDYYRFRENWVEVPNDEFRESVREALRGDRWVADGNYGAGRDLAEGDPTGVAGLPDLRGDVEAVLADDRSWGAAQGAMAREQGEAVVALRFARFAVPLGAEDSLAAAATDTVAFGATGAWSPGAGAPAVAESGARVDEGDSAGVIGGESGRLHPRPSE